MVFPRSHCRFLVQKTLRCLEHCCTSRTAVRLVRMILKIAIHIIGCVLQSKHDSSSTSTTDRMAKITYLDSTKRTLKEKKQNQIVQSLHFTSFLPLQTGRLWAHRKLYFSAHIMQFSNPTAQRFSLVPSQLRALPNNTRKYKDVHQSAFLNTPASSTVFNTSGVKMRTLPEPSTKADPSVSLHLLTPPSRTRPLATYMLHDLFTYPPFLHKPYS